MPAPNRSVPAKSFKLDLSHRGYQVLFHVDGANRCPGCGRSHWFVGRITAECGFCGTALPLAEAALAGLNPAGQRAVALHLGEAAPPRANGSEKRRHERAASDGRVIALHFDGSPHAFAIENFSAGGMMGAALPGLAEAASLMVELEDGSMLPAEIRWTDRETVGLAFIDAGDSPAAG